jgi:hypothetical protein
MPTRKAVTGYTDLTSEKAIMHRINIFIEYFDRVRSQYLPLVCRELVVSAV